ncbi:MAG: RsmD family RNA methyltransferase [Spirochaetes bacterium]|nr:RsmD family RNA methyltransferase [Spirochaetota bacterium]
MRVISGKYKGKEIPFENEKFNNANSTPQKVKKAVFSILGEDLTGKSFLDLYSCSGQMGIEALSRGADFVVFNEIDKNRFKFIRSIIDTFKPDDALLVLNFHAYRCMRYCDSKDYKFDFIFIDAPFLRVKKHEDQYREIFNELNKYNLLKVHGKIIIQHPAKARLNGEFSSCKYLGTKKYAKNALSVYQKGFISIQGHLL